MDSLVRVETMRYYVTQLSYEVPISDQYSDFSR
jgi:hypothetical protein